ncbi:hypothetical protein CEE37_10610 [candidate division LCP-89 bacterium B3_LCP]|uniref:Transferase n=1 Tax=candidate division LCP-89 bacterium B3_LCP TaxID=2012998 RepID=A0A532UXU7_UNCL8|nr:MAG: hypothetical protein CEE37_10610 [candidate division LCP-89 bacterium B3_LCP]
MTITRSYTIQGSTLVKSPGAIVLFEDQAAITTEPLSLTRPVWDLRCGIRTLREKILAYFPQAAEYHFTRPYLSGNYPGAKPSPEKGIDLLWINGCLIPGVNFKRVLDLAPGDALVSDGRVIAFCGNPPSGWEAGTALDLHEFNSIEAVKLSGSGTPGVQATPTTEALTNIGVLVTYIWEAIGAMNEQIDIEARELRSLGQLDGNVHKNASLVSEEDIYLADGSDIMSGVVLDASNGPIVADEGVIIGYNSIIEGPVYLGAGSQVKPLSHIRGSCFGEQSRMGGEVSVSIIQDYSNKQHGGFLGHSYIGSWCNLGSGTETSNLKNNYTPVKVQVGSKLVDTGQLFVGLMMGDHSKSAIGSVFNTGTVMGVGSMIFGAGFPPRYVPSFNWGGAEKLTKYPLKPTLETARSVMRRRQKELTDGEIKILTWIHENRTS